MYTPPPAYPGTTAPLLPQPGFAPAAQALPQPQPQPQPQQQPQPQPQPSQMPYAPPGYGVQYQPVSAVGGQLVGQPYMYQPVMGMAYQPTVAASSQIQAGYPAYAAVAGSAGFVATGANGQPQQFMVMGQPQTIGGSQVVVVSAAGQADQRLHRIKDFLCLSVFTTICCNIFFGIIAIVYSVRVRDSKRCNDFEGARSANRVVIAMNVTGIVINIVIILVLVIVNVTGALAANSMISYGRSTSN